jgi:PAS domain S-box-containing protein
MMGKDTCPGLPAILVPMPHTVPLISEQPRQRLPAQFALVLVGVPLLVLLMRYVPVVGQMPRVPMLGVIVAMAVALDSRAALIGVLLVAAGLEATGPRVPIETHVVRALVFVIIGTAVVALAYARRVQTRESRIYRMLFEQHPLPMWMFDEDSLRFLAVNDAAVRTYGYSREEFGALTLRDVRPQEDVAKLDGRTSYGTPQATGFWRHRNKVGAVFDVLIRSQAIALGRRRARLALIEDISERRSVEEQLRQAQKMEAIGQLAGGIAHDFNNLLTAILGYADLVKEDLDADDPRRRDMEEITRAATSAAALTQHLLAFSRKQVLQVRVISLTATIEQMIPMLRRLLGETIELRSVLGSASNVEADPVQVQQIVMNLLVNAKDALPRGGRITIETTDVELDDAYASEHANVSPGRFAVLIVSDNGVGMDPATQTRIFEPFFTTKPAGKGTGLGLSTVYGIVKQSGGHVWVYSEVGRGTTFKIYFPVTADAAAAVVRRPARASVGANRATVLLVEDEAGVRSFVTRLLRRAGYTMLVAASPAEARADWERADVRIDLLVTDVVLPEMDGRAVADQVRAHHPGCRVLFMSGYTRDGAVTNGLVTDGEDFLAKPFTADDFMRRVAAVLDVGPPNV